MLNDTPTGTMTIPRPLRKGTEVGGAPFLAIPTASPRENTPPLVGLWN